MTNYRSLFLSLIIGLLPLGIYAQTPEEIAQLEQSLEGTDSDSARVNILVKLGEYYESNNFEKAKQFVEEAVQLAEKNDWTWAKIKAYERAGFIGTLSGDYGRAIKFDNWRLSLLQQAGDSAQLPRAYNYLGNDYADLGQFEKAYFFFTKSFRLAQKLRDSLTMSIAAHNIGDMFKELGQYEIALNHFEFASKMSNSLKDLEAVAYGSEERGDLFLRKGELDKAETYLQKALQSSREHNVVAIEPRIATRLASLYLKKGDEVKALAYYDSAGQLYQKTTNMLGLATVDIGKGKVLVSQKKFREAETLFEKSLVTAEGLNAQKLQIESYHELSKLAELEGNTTKALEYFKKFHQAQDSLFSQDMEQQLFRDQLQFETEYKDQEIAALSEAKAAREDQLKRQELVRNILVIVVALFGILLFTIYRSGQRRIKINKLLLEHQEEMKKRSVELEQLNQVKDKFFSIISHDLRSPMNALSGILTMMDNNQIKPEEFSKLTKELKVQFNHTRTLINNLLDWALLQMEKLKIVPEKIDLRVMSQTNFSLLSSLHAKEIRFDNQIREGVFGWADLNMINLVFRNLILNAIKFTESGGLITISAKDLGSFYEIAIADNGVGIKPEIQKMLFEKTTGYSTRGTANEKGTGLGLILCKEFVEKNGGTIRLTSEEGRGSTFYFTIQKAKEV